MRIGIQYLNKLDNVLKKYHIRPKDICLVSNTALTYFAVREKFIDIDELEDFKKAEKILESL